MEKVENFIAEEKRQVSNEYSNVLPSAPPLEPSLPPPLQPVGGPPPPYPGDPNHHDDIQKLGDLKLASNPETDVAQQAQIIADGTSTVIIVPEEVEIGSTLVLVSEFDISEKKIRLGFARKVFGIVLMQLLITTVIMCLIRQSPSFVHLALRLKYLTLSLLMLVYIFTFLLMLWNKGLRRKVPYNYIVLLFFTLSLATIVGIGTAPIGNDLMVMAGVTTFVLVVALTLFACQTKLDFTFLSCSCLCLMLIFLFFGVAVFFVPYKLARLAYTTIVIIISALYIVWDIQLIIGGDHSCNISPEDYVFAALILYFDIVYLFIRILRSRS